MNLPVTTQHVLVEELSSNYIAYTTFEKGLQYPTLYARDEYIVFQQAKFLSTFEKEFYTVVTFVQRI